jgi:hypothetical protein
MLKVWCHPERQKREETGSESKFGVLEGCFGAVYGWKLPGLGMGKRGEQWTGLHACRADGAHCVQNGTAMAESPEIRAFTVHATFGSLSDLRPD